jgi:hypothetical protein
MTQTVSHFEEVLVQLPQSPRRPVLQALTLIIFVVAAGLAFACRAGCDYVIYFTKRAASVFLIAVLLLYLVHCAVRTPTVTGKTP